jgi:hypothetical protein
LLAAVIGAVAAVEAAVSLVSRLSNIVIGAQRALSDALRGVASPMR